MITLCHKKSPTSYNTTEAELDAATTLTKLILWLRIPVYVDDASLPYTEARIIPTAAQFFHTGKKTHNVCHMATTTQKIQ